MTPHNNAKAGDFAKTVLMPGDPLRAKLIAENFLDGARLVTSVRNVLGYTGTYKGVPVSVMASGMGMPSIGIYSHELYSQYGVENIIRVGSAGSYVHRLNVKDVVLAEYAASQSSFAMCMSNCPDTRIYPNAELNKAILDSAAALGIECKLAKVNSSDVFYDTPEVGGWRGQMEKTQTECVEMESFALFHIANVLGKRASCLLTISDSFETDAHLTSEQRQHSFSNMIRLALEASVSLK